MVVIANAWGKWQYKTTPLIFFFQGGVNEDHQETLESCDGSNDHGTYEVCRGTAGSIQATRT